jgi:osmoprotectant transport system substrate-binding protein
LNRPDIRQLVGAVLAWAVRGSPAIVLFWAVLSLALLPAAGLAQAIVVGAKEFTEQLLVSEMTSQLLRARGFNAHKGTGFATTGIRTLQERGIIDVYWEYTGPL